MTLKRQSLIRKAVLSAIALGAGLSAFVSLMYVTNPPPMVPAIASPLADGTPFVLKLHAQWCPVCMATKGVWSQIQAAYAGRVHLVVFDFTNDATTDASRREAARLGLERVFAENEGWTGTVLVVDGRSRDVTASIHGGRDFEEYRLAVDSALNRTLAQRGHQRDEVR